ncbi:MAG: PAS domain S-box protein, partial [Candidatus Atribacteria bacterium]|nr:PAS domain S-box protein [Candidatus Atribacteria bacterium]
MLSLATTLFNIIFKNTLFQIADYNFTLFALAVLLTSLVILSIGIMVLIREKASRESIFFFLIILFTFLWLFPDSFMYVSPNEETAIRWDKFACFGLSFVPTALFQFTIFALRTYPSQQRKARISWILSCFFAIWFLISDNFILGAELYPWGYFTYFGWPSIPFLIFFFYILFASPLQYYKKSREEVSPIAKLRTRLLFRAIIVADLGVIEFLPTLGVPIPPLAFIFVLSFAFLGAPVIWRYHLVDITPALAAQEVINNMSDALLVFDREGIVQLVNPAFLHLVGRKAKEVKGLPIKSLLPDLFSSEGEKFLSEGPRMNRSLTLPRADGKQLSLEASLSPIQKNDEILAWVALIRDVTELKKAEARLSRSEMRYRTIFENTGSATILIEEDMTIALANREFEKLSGLPKEAIEGKQKFTQFFATSDLPMMVEYHQKRRINPEAVPKQYTTHFLDQAGKTREVLANLDLIPHTKQSVASLIDVSDLKIAEKQIAFQLNMLSHLYQDAQQLSATLDLEKLAQLAVDYSVQEFEVKSAFFLTCQDNQKWEILATFPAPFPSLLTSWFNNSPEKDCFLADFEENNSPWVVNFTEPTPYPQLTKVAQELALKELIAFHLGKPPHPWGALIWLVDKPDFLSSLSGFIQTFIHQVTTSGEQARLFKQLQQYINMMRSLHSIDRAIASSLDLTLVLDFSLQEAVHHLKIDAMGVYLIDPSSSILHYKAGLGFLFPEATTSQFYLGEGALGKVVLEKKPLLVSHMEEVEPSLLPAFVAKEKFLSLFAVPLVAKGKTQGALIAFHRLSFHPPLDWIEFLTT